MSANREPIGHLYAKEVYPQVNSVKAKSIEDLKTVGLKLTLDEVKELKGLLENAIEQSDKWDTLDVTGYRNTNQVTVTYYPPVSKR
ncbi:hypothetical protein MKY91_20485 [Alkalicoccobacillus gibsonii]|uniref:Uncharacterized protein n=1 Tax=Alkalicoccobacillus gibsonii TaxID=79881 RepID=A0ABU9VNQ2_9BACI